MKLLLTGATGFVGRNFLGRALKSNLYSEILLPLRSVEKLRAQLMGDGFETIPPQIRVVPWNARDPFPEDLGFVDHVIHLLGLLFGDHRHQYWETNVWGTQRLLSKVGSASRIVLLSSQAAGGPSGNNLARTETDPEAPITWYGQSKLAMEELARRDFAHLPLVILRPPMVLGAKDSATLPLFKMARLPVRFKPGRREKLYSFVAVDDLVEAIECVCNSKLPASNQSFFVAHSEIISDKDLILAAAQALNKPGLTVPIPQGAIPLFAYTVNRFPSLKRAFPSLSGDRVREIMMDRWIISPKKFETAYGWKARTSLREAIRQAKDWYSRSGQL